MKGSKGTSNPAYTHGHTQGKFSPTYYSWASMKTRCLNPKSFGFKYYGAQGITICERWFSFENFLADMGERPPGLTLDRIEGYKGYEPGNCRWATKAEQSRNRSNKIVVELAGRQMPLAEACTLAQVKIQAVHWARWKWKLTHQQALGKVMGRV